jgi:hypothetical protein
VCNFPSYKVWSPDFQFGWSLLRTKLGGKKFKNKGNKVEIQVRTYFESLGLEIEALKHRVRYLIQDLHWQTDGEWKESVLRQILRRHLPSTVGVGRGFVVTGKATSSQVDILLYDVSKPVVFRDADLVFVTPDSIIGLLEVKSSMTNNLLSSSAEKLARNIELVRLHPNIRAFAGIFSFEDQTRDPRRSVGCISDASATWNRKIDFVSLGTDRFIRFWETEPGNSRKIHHSWHSYKINRLAQGYFVHNVIDAVCPHSVFENQDVWFPHSSKEVYLEEKARAPWSKVKKR